MAGIDEGRHVFRPGFLVEVSSKEPAGFILEQGIDTDGVPALKVVEDGLVVERQKRLVRAIATLYPGLFADATHPLVATGRRIPFPAGLCTYPEFWVDIVPATEKLSE